MERLTTLPTRPLTMSATTMEFAFGDDAYVYLVTYLVPANAPTDLTKLQFDRTGAVLDPAGAVLADLGRMDTHFIYNDPSTGIRTPADFNPAAAIMAEVEVLRDGIAAWAHKTLDAPPLFQQLAPADPAATDK